MTRRTKKQWRKRNEQQRKGMIILSMIDLTLKGLAWRDLARRPAAEVRGPKFAWFLGTLVNMIGPIGYFLFGRKRREISPTHH